jgi:DUF2934 family protein
MGKRTTSKNDWGRRAGTPPARDPAGDGARVPTAPRPDSLEDEIRLRAYYRYLERETEDGDAMTDWLEAESDILGRRATGVQAVERSSDEEAGTS